MPNKQARWSIAVLVALITFYVPINSWAQAEQAGLTELFNTTVIDCEAETEVTAASLTIEEMAMTDEAEDPPEIVEKSSEPLLNESTRDLFVLTERGLPSYRQAMEVEATAYTHTGNPTFTGVYPQIGTIAVDPKVIPLGTRMYVEGYGFGIAQDTGGLIKGEIIDLFMDTEKECFQWGRRNVKIYILE